MSLHTTIGAILSPIVKVVEQVSEFPLASVTYISINVSPISAQVNVVADKVIVKLQLSVLPLLITLESITKFPFESKNAIGAA